MARTAQTTALLLLIATIACSSPAAARSLRSLQQPAVAPSMITSSSSTPRRVLAGRMQLPSVSVSVAVKPIAAAAALSSAAAPLPADIAVTASGCAAVQQQQPGARAAATFTVAAPTAPELFKQVALQVDFPRALWPGASLSCVDSKAQAITCPAPEFSPEQLASEDLLATACMLGDMVATGPVTCTFAYTVPATTAAAGSSSSSQQVLAAVTFDPLPANAVENGENNAAFACTTA